MEIDVLREILMLAEKRNYAAAADALFISTSTLSRHIAALENQLGVVLFHRNSRNVQVTQHGEMLVSYAEKITQMEDEYLDKLNQVKRKEGNGIRIGAFFGLSSHGLMAQIASFLRQNQDISLSLHSEEQGELLDMLRKDRYDFVLVQEEGPSFDDEFNRMTVSMDRLVAILPQDHLLAQAESVRLTQLQREEFLLQPNQSMPYRLILDAFHRAGYTPKQTQMEITGVGAIELVEQGLGVALAQEKVVKEKNPSGVALVPLQPLERIWINLVWRAEGLPAPGRAFVAHFRDVVAGKQ